MFPRRLGYEFRDHGAKDLIGDEPIAVLADDDVTPCPHYVDVGHAGGIGQGGGGPKLERFTIRIADLAKEVWKAGQDLFEPLRGHGEIFCIESHQVFASHRAESSRAQVSARKDGFSALCSPCELTGPPPHP